MNKQIEISLECKKKSITELLKLILSEDNYWRFSAARELQNYPYAVLREFIHENLLYSKKYKHREIAAFLIGQMQSELLEEEVYEIKKNLLYLLVNDKTISVKSMAIISLAHLFSNNLLNKKDFTSLEKILMNYLKFNNYSIKFALSFAFSFFPKRLYIKSYLEKLLCDKNNSIVSWALFAIKQKKYQSNKINNILIKKIKLLKPYTDLYFDIIIFFIQNNYVEIIPYIEDLLKFKKIDNDLFEVLLENNDNRFIKIKKLIIEKFE